MTSSPSEEPVVNTPAQEQAPTPERAPWKTALKIAVGLGSSALFVWLAARGVEWDAFGRAAADMRWSHVAGYLGVIGAAHVLRLTRWGMMLRPMAPELSWRRIVSVGAVGVMAVFALPARLGELVRPVMISRGGKVAFGEATATVVAERLIDGLCMSVMLLVTVLMLDADKIPPRYVQSGYVATAVFGGLSLGLVVGGLVFPRVAPLIRRILSTSNPALAERLVGMMEGFFNALRLMSSWRVAGGYLSATALMWFLSGLAIWVLFGAFAGPIAGLPVVAGFSLLSVIIVGIMIPAGPGTVGVFHWAVVFGLGIFGVDKTTAFLYGTTLHLLIASVNVGGGLLGWAFGGASLRGALGREPAPKPSPEVAP